MVQGDAAQVNVVVGFLAGGEDHVPAHHSQLHNQLAQAFTGFFNGEVFRKLSHSSSVAAHVQAAQAILRYPTTALSRR